MQARRTSDSAERRGFPGRPYDLLPIGHMAAARDGRLLRVNPNLAAMLGYASEEEMYRVCGGAVQKVFEESTDWAVLVSLADTRGELERYPAILRQRGGEILPCMVWVRLSSWPWASIQAVELVVQSVAERHQAFAALTQVLRLYRDMMDLNPDPVLIHEQKRIMLANRAAEAFFGFTEPGALVGRSIEDLLDPNCLDVLSRHFQAAATSLPVEEEFQLVLAGGEKRWVRNYSTRITFHSKPATLNLLHDCTARRQAEDLHLTMVEHAPDAMVIHDDGVILFANPAAAALFHVASPAALTGWTLFDLFHPESRPVLHERRRIVHTSPSPCKGEYAFRLLDGEPRHVFVSSVRVTYQGRRVLLSVFHDLTARRQAEAERDQALASYEELFQSAPLGIAWALPDRRFSRVNRGMAEMYGYPSPEAMIAEVGDIASDFFDDPEDYWRLRRRVENQEVVRDYECLCRRRDGSRFWTSHSIRAVRGLDGGLDGFEAFVRDVTACRQTEAERDLALESYETLFQAAPLGIVVFVLGQGCVRVNQRMTEIFGYPSPQTMVAEVGSDPARLYADPADHARLLRLAESRGEVWDFECLSRRRNGELFWASRCIRVIYGPAGGMVGYEAFVRDITERRRAKEEAAERGRRVHILAGELAMSSERERRGMARDLHDGPVQHLALATLMVEDLARRQERGQEFIPALDLLREAAGQLRSVMEDLTPPALFADSLADTLACLGRGFFSRHELEVDVSCPRLPGLSRDGVAFLCRTVRELLVNAVKHGRAKRAWVLVDVRGPSLWLTVKDDGKGFDSFLLDAGEPASQGLPGLRSLCRDLGGCLVLDSAPGQGTRVVLDLHLDLLCGARPLL